MSSTSLIEQPNVKPYGSVSCLGRTWTLSDPLLIEVFGLSVLSGARYEDFERCGSVVSLKKVYPSTIALTIRSPLTI
jgi:hypothetical protein